MITFLTDRPAWRDRAQCRGVDPDLFFPETGEPGTEAKRVCWGCAVREECLAYALDNREKFGVWGGLSEAERRRMRSRRRWATRRCQWVPCQMPFTPKSDSQVYCMPSCAEAAKSARKSGRRVG